MNAGNFYVWQADCEPSKPLCVSTGDRSFTIWTNPDGSVRGFLTHKYDSPDGGEIVDVKGAGDIPAEYVAYEENARV